MRRPTPWLLLLPLALLPGCGGHNGTAQTAEGVATGSVRLSIAWPERSRLIPYAAESLYLVFIAPDVPEGVGPNDEPLEDVPEPPAPALLTRPLSGEPAQHTVVFENLICGKWTLLADAYAAADGSGEPLASGAVTFDITFGSDGPVPVALTMDSVIESFTIDPETTSLQLGETGTLTATARDKDGNAVLIPGVDWGVTTGGEYVSLVSSRAATSYQIGVTGTGSGEATIEATVNEGPGTTRTGAATVGVETVVVNIGPGSAELYAGEQQQFSATVSGAVNTDVTWTTTGGTITDSGVYTAPNTIGDYSVTATSQADPSKSDEASVNVGHAPSMEIVGETFDVVTSFDAQFGLVYSNTLARFYTVEWTATGGTINGGYYLAPDAAGVYTLTATATPRDESEDLTPLSAQATVTVFDLGEFLLGSWSGPFHYVWYPPIDVPATASFDGGVYRDDLGGVPSEHPYKLVRPNEVWLFLGSPEARWSKIYTVTQAEKGSPDRLSLTDVFGWWELSRD